MAADPELVRYVADQFSGAGTITCRKMFGEYGLYCNGKFFAMICDDCLFVKITSAGRERFPKLPEAPPYEGAKNCFLVDDIDDRQMLTELAAITCACLPATKPKSKKKRGSD